jgi:hypothetical protein
MSREDIRKRYRLPDLTARTRRVTRLKWRRGTNNLDSVLLLDIEGEDADSGMPCNASTKSPRGACDCLGLRLRGVSDAPEKPPFILIDRLTRSTNVIVMAPVSSLYSLFFPILLVLGGVSCTTNQFLNLSMCFPEVRFFPPPSDMILIQNFSNLNSIETPRNFEKAAVERLAAFSDAYLPLTTWKQQVNVRRTHIYLFLLEIELLVMISDPFTSLDSRSGARQVLH